MNPLRSTLALSAAALLVVTGGVTAAQAGPAADLNCDDFQLQQEAQDVLDADPSDPNGLDEDGDGLACEDAGLGVPDGFDPATLTPAEREEIYGDGDTIAEADPATSIEGQARYTG